MRRQYYRMYQQEKSSLSSLWRRSFMLWSDIAFGTWLSPEGCLYMTKWWFLLEHSDRAPEICSSFSAAAGPRFRPLHTSLPVSLEKIAIIWKTQGAPAPTHRFTILTPESSSVQWQDHRQWGGSGCGNCSLKTSGQVCRSCGSRQLPDWLLITLKSYLVVLII